jgi:hypothetical protein
MASNDRISECFISKLQGRKLPCSYFRYRPGMPGQPRKTSLKTLRHDFSHKLEALLLPSFNVREMFPARRHCSPTLAECLVNHQLRESTSVFPPSLLYPHPASRDSFRTNCENRMFGNPVWYMRWQIYDIISVML